MRKYIKLIIAFCLVMIVVVLNSINTKAVTENNEKVYCNATINDDFADDKVSIILTKEETMLLKDYAKEDFVNENICVIGISSLQEITEELTQTIRNKIQESNGNENIDFGTININEFCRIFELTIENKSKQNVLMVIRAIENDNRFKYVGVDYYNNFECASFNESNENRMANEFTYIDNKMYDEYIDKLGFSKILDAREICTGSSDVKVGVLDTGITYNNTAYSNNIDKDLAMTFCNYLPMEDPRCVDNYGHGEYIACIIGGKGEIDVYNDDNVTTTKKNIYGVCENVKMISLKIYGSSDTTNDEYYKVRSLRVASALAYASENNIKILNSSIGSDMINLENSLVEQQAIKNYNGLIVSASGNDATNIDINKKYLPSYDFDNIITVGALSKDGKFAERGGSEWNDNFGSNYGKETVDLFAPGTTILTTKNEKIIAVTGTSFAAPFVTGTAALLLSKYPNLSPLMIKKILMETVELEESLINKCVTSGRLDAHKALILNGIQGEGTQANPYLIRNEFEFNCIQALDGDRVCFKQVADIDFENKEHHLNGHTFKGIYDGNNYYLKNIIYSKASDTGKQLIGSLFGANHGTIKNVKISNSIIELAYSTSLMMNVGSVVGANNGYIYNVQLNNGFISAISQNTNIGGLIGTNCTSDSISIENSHVKNTIIYSNGHTGGIVGENEDGVIKNCSFTSNSFINYSQVTLANKGVGGIIGFNKGNVLLCSIDNTSLIKYDGIETTSQIKPCFGLIIGLNWYPLVNINTCTASGTLNQGNLRALYGQLDNFGKFYEQKIGLNE